MMADMEQEYYGFLLCVWQPFSHDATNPAEPQQELEHIYDSVSLASSKFLRNKLEGLEEQTR